MAELVYAHDSKSCAARLVGSTPTLGIMKKILVILGPTAVGKSDLAVRLAKKLNGEIISADSRQVYKSLDLGSGKITKKEMRGIPHYLLDITNPKRQFSIAEYKALAEKKIEEILKRRKVPIIVGGTPFYIQSIVDNIAFPEVKPNLKLRKKLSKLSAGKLFLMLKKLDPARAKTIEAKNPRRLIRAIEIVKALGKVPLLKPKPKYAALQIGLITEDGALKKRIYKRLIARIKHGMIEEAKRLHKQGLSYKRMEELGLEYKYLALFLQKKITREEMANKLNRATWDFVRRQKTWWKRDKRIKWFNPTQKSNLAKMEKIAKTFVS